MTLPNQLPAEAARTELPPTPCEGVTLKIHERTLTRKQKTNMDSLISVWRETPSGCISHCIYSVPCLSVCMHDMKCPQIFHYGRKKKADRHITDTEVTTSHMTTWFHWSDNAHRQDNRRSSAPSRGSSSDHETSETTKASGDLSGRFTTQSSRTKGMKQNTNTCIYIH